MGLVRIAPALLVALGSAAICQASLVVTTPNTPTLFTFDSDVPGVFVAAVGGGLNANGSIGEPDGWAMNTNNPNRQGGFLSTAASADYEWTGAAFPFAADYNNNGSTDNYLNINDRTTIQNTIESGLPTRVLQVSEAEDWGTNAFYLRIQNNTGATVTSWTVTADLFCADNNTSVSTFSLGYAAANGVNPGAMTFTDVATRLGVNTGGVFAYQAIEGLDETIPATIANGDYLVLAFRDSTGDGSGFAADNVAITAVVPEPGSAAIVGLSMLGLVASRRRQA